MVVRLFWWNGEAIYDMIYLDLWFLVQIEFDDESTKTFADITTNNIGNTIGIYLNDEMIANPRVMCAITEGSCQIEVDTYEQAQVLSEALEKCK